ncbi:MAG: efflux RND transporter periplasmic adaptor subunit [Acidobacteriota bacterium]
MSRRLAVAVACVLCLSAALPRGQSPAPAADVVPVVARTLDKTVDIPGDLTAHLSVAMHARIAGFVETISVDRGDPVTRGQIIARLAAPELRAQRAEADARLRAARAQLAEAGAAHAAALSTSKRLQAASATPGAVAANDLELAERAADAAAAHVAALSAAVAAAEAAERALADLEGYLQLTAPFNGVITERLAHPGSLVGPSTPPVVRLEQVSRLRLTVPVPEAYLAVVPIGATVDFAVAASPNRTFHGTIARAARSLDVKTRSMAVEIDVANQDGMLAPGMFAQVRWPVARPSATLFVPPSAVVRTSERQFVVRVRDGVADWVDVRRGETVDGLIEVFGDLREGDQVVRRGNDEIRPGTRISPRTPGR